MQMSCQLSDCVGLIFLSLQMIWLWSSKCLIWYLKDSVKLFLRKSSEQITFFLWLLLLVGLVLFPFCLLSLILLLPWFGITSQHDNKQVIPPRDYRCKLSRSAALWMCLCFAKPFYNCIFLFMDFPTIAERWMDHIALCTPHVCMHLFQLQGKK